MNIDEFARQILEDVKAEAEISEDGDFQENIFTQHALDILIQAGECIDPQACYYRTTTGRKINAFDYLPDSDAFDLFVVDFDASTNIKSISWSDTTAALKRCRRVLE